MVATAYVVWMPGNHFVQDHKHMDSSYGWTSKLHSAQCFKTRADAMVVASFLIFWHNDYVEIRSVDVDEEGQMSQRAVEKVS